MDRRRAAYRLLTLYVVALFVLGVGTVLWLVRPALVASPTVGLLWFAFAGFGLLSLVLVVLFYRLGE